MIYIYIYIYFFFFFLGGGGGGGGGGHEKHWCDRHFFYDLMVVIWLKASSFREGFTGFWTSKH